MITERVRQDQDVEPLIGNKVAKRVGKRWRVYEDGSYYSQTSGGVMVQGKAMRDVDEKPVAFATLQEAEQWVKDGCKVVDERGNPLTLR
jgi:hypothetical protein